MMERGATMDLVKTNSDIPVLNEQTLTVCVRIRPLNEDEILSGCGHISHKVANNAVVLLDPNDDSDDVLRANRSRERQFAFDNAFDVTTSQNDVYQETTHELIEGVITGYNATVFAYGPTGAGKTHTMLGTDQQPGIMSRTMEDLFAAMDNSDGGHRYTVTMSYLEIYNEMIRDLLSPAAGYLDLREDSLGGVHVAGLSAATASSTKEVMELLTRGNQLRTTEPTAANKTSSRSHAVLQISVQCRAKLPTTNVGSTDLKEEVRVGRLFLIDLAGSERAASGIGNEERRRVEGAHINRSLLALGNCINALASDATAKRYINYRDSKLTRLLKDALGGNCKTVMIAHISPASVHFEESRNTLIYANRAKSIKTKVRMNVTEVSQHILQYNAIIADLKEEIFRLQDKLKSTTGGNPSDMTPRVVKSDKNPHHIASLKDKLLNMFQEQLQIRKGIVDIEGIISDIKLDYQRNMLLLSEWEAEKILRMKTREEKTDDLRLRICEKAADQQGTSFLPDPPDITDARSELEYLREELSRCEELKIQADKELDDIKRKTKLFEDSLPSKLNSNDQLELFSLVARIHQLEVDQLNLQSQSALKELDMQRRELAIDRLQRQRKLSNQIIDHQRDLLVQQGQLTYPKELEQLVQLYRTEEMDPLLQDPTKTIDMSPVFPTEVHSNPLQRPQRTSAWASKPPVQLPLIRSLHHNRHHRHSTSSTSQQPPCLSKAQHKELPALDSPDKTTVSRAVRKQNHDGYILWSSGHHKEAASTTSDPILPSVRLPRNNNESADKGVRRGHGGVFVVPKQGDLLLTSTAGTADNPDKYSKRGPHKANITLREDNGELRQLEWNPGSVMVYQLPTERHPKHQQVHVNTKALPEMAFGSSLPKELINQRNKRRTFQTVSKTLAKPTPTTSKSKNWVCGQTMFL